MSDQPYLVSARKYRPQDWEAVVGQAGITQTLQQSIASGQIAQAYLFCGPRGVGKTTSARIFARAINGFDAADDALAFNVFELDAASNNKVEDIRSIVEQVRIPPQKGKYKVYIIDEVHMLSQAAFNAFLKTLEEPPGHAVFILATTEKHKILPTILSRCQIFDFHRITVPDTIAHLQRIAAQEGVVAELQALHTIASKADGALRDALSMFDQLVAFAGKNLTAQAVAEQLHVLDHDTYFSLTDCALNSDIPGALLQFDEVMAKGFDAHHFVSGWASHMRNLMVCRDAQTLKLLEVTDEVKVQFQEQAARADLFFIVGALDVLNQADVQFRGSQHQRLLVELALMQVCSHEALKKKSPDEGLMPPSKAPTIKSSGGSAMSTSTNSPSENSSVLVAVQDSPAISRTEPEAPRRAPVDSPADMPVDSPAGAPLEVLPVQTAVPSIPRAGGLRKSKRAIVTPGGAIKASVEAEKQEGEGEGAGMVVDPSWKDEVTEEGVCAVWDSFVAKLRQEDKVALATTMAAHLPVLEGLEVRFDVGNPLQREQMDSLRTEVLTALKTELRNASLSLKIEVAEQPLESRKAFLSDRERYDLMVEKNPALDALRKALDLDLG
ncbi:MAG: DNA polymerase III subunit gamma/tau [Bacteroidetes bacterium]|nr:DNA polymerase III subunit gamma/tau [Bacteroidota bacterium]MDA0902906.1 DNA polymerase III subunit gamma/tau [Bacteroidota bacterium]MDA1241837.1 DNA polymerase III subunit gamma/tau [Bacteroidota bacterium]